MSLTYLSTSLSICLSITHSMCLCVYLSTSLSIYPSIYLSLCTYLSSYVSTYGVAAISRLLKITALFCKISSFLQGSFAKETYIFRVMYLPIGWLRLVGSLKLQLSFAEYSFFYRALLQKRAIILRSLLIVATPYQWKYLSVHHLSIYWVALVSRID